MHVQSGAFGCICKHAPLAMVFCRAYLVGAACLCMATNTVPLNGTGPGVRGYSAATTQAAHASWYMHSPKPWHSPKTLPQPPPRCQVSVDASALPPGLHTPTGADTAQ